jgi:Tol biopolymer transport system component
LLRRCVERNPRNRLHDIADARIVIDDVLAGRGDMGNGSVPAVAHGTGWTTKAAWLGAGLVLGASALGVLGRTLFAAKPLAPPVIRSLTYSGKSRTASIAADGRNIAFVSDRDGTQRIWVKQLATGEEVALTAGTDDFPRVSPDGSSILFLRRADRAFELFRIPSIGGEPRRLASDVVSADWSPDGKQIAFTRDDGEHARVILIPSDGGEEKALAENAAFFRGVAWSWDGARIAVEATPRTNTITGRILATLDVPSGAWREVYQIPSGSVSSAVRWDGSDALIFAWAPSQAGRGEVMLYRLTLGSAKPRALFSFVSLPQRAEVAGPGALLFDGGGNHRNLFEVKSDGALGHALTGGPSVDRQPTYSPDGRRIVFSSDRSGSLDLWSLEVATGALRRLTFDAADDWDPQWSPDGKHLLWSSNRGGHFEVWIADVDGTQTVWMRRTRRCPGTAPGSSIRPPTPHTPASGRSTPTAARPRTSSRGVISSPSSHPRRDGLRRSTAGLPP